MDMNGKGWGKRTVELTALGVLAVGGVGRWPLKGLSRVMGNCHARFLGGLGPTMANGYPVYQASEISEIS